MALPYDAALPRLLELCEAFPDFGNVDIACVVRDLRGRLRLVCQPASGVVTPDWAGLQQALEAGLEGWFAGPLLRTDASGSEERGAAREILQRRQGWPPGWPAGPPDALGVATQLHTRWCALPRTHAKEDWLAGVASPPPWPLLPGRTPIITSFFSFKGGVGRSTALALVARRLALEGKKVIAVDLDLEAPGLAPLLGVDPEVGVLDALLQHAATGTLDLAGLVQEVEVRGASLRVVGAGRLGWSHLEKLARLDYLHGAGMAASPVEKGLHELLNQLKRAHAPDMILLDARAGLHDMAGLALHGLAHVDVLVGRDNAQSVQGLDLTLQVLARRRPKDQLRLLLVQTFVPSNARDFVARRYRDEVYRLFGRHIYGEGTAPALDDASASHSPVTIPDLGDVGAPRSLQEADGALLEHDDYKMLARRLLERGQ